eukprot:scaffold8163_cov258-Pinguiococcus_pyrenoidosus.AAC.2
MSSSRRRGKDSGAVADGVPRGWTVAIGPLEVVLLAGRITGPPHELVPGERAWPPSLGRRPAHDCLPSLPGLPELLRAALARRLQLHGQRERRRARPRSLRRQAFSRTRQRRRSEHLRMHPGLWCSHRVCVEGLHPPLAALVQKEQRDHQNEAIRGHPPVEDIVQAVLRQEELQDKHERLQLGQMLHQVLHKGRVGETGVPDAVNRDVQHEDALVLCNVPARAQS